MTENFAEERAVHLLDGTQLSPSATRAQAAKLLKIPVDRVVGAVVTFDNMPRSFRADVWIDRKWAEQ